MNKKIYYCLIALFATIFLISSFMLGDYFIKSSIAKSEYDEIAQLMESGKDQAQSTVPFVPPVKPVPETPDNTDPSAPEETTEDCNVWTPSDNVILYGHNMKDGSMFATLLKYRKQSYWEEHRYIHFNTLLERHTYEIVATFKTTATIGQGFDYQMFANADTEEEFDDYIATAKSLAFYDTGVTAEYGDKLITLSTCDASLTNGRLVVVAKRVN